MIYVKEGDTRPVAQAVLTRGTVIVDLTLADSVTFKMKEETSNVLKVNAAAVVTDAVGGAVEYRWVTADTDTAGLYNAEWQVNWQDGSVETFPTIGFDVVMIHGDLD